MLIRFVMRIAVLALLVMMVVAACAPLATLPVRSETSQPGEPMPEDGSEEAPVVAVPESEVEDLENMVREDIFLNSQELVLMESFPVQVALILGGDMPTPCHQLVYNVSEPSAENRIDVEVYSVISPAATCIAVLQPFEVSINLGSFPAGMYEVYLNGQLAGEFQS